MLAMFMPMFMLSMKVLHHLKQQVFPAACVICNTHMDTHHHMQVQQGFCCASCLNNIKIMPQSVCEYCGITLPLSLAPGPCGSCLQQTPPQQHTSSLYVYEGAVREALLAWKLQGDSSGLRWLLQTSSLNLQQIFSANDLLIPVPMPIQRMRQSGLHHSADLCAMIANIVGCKTDWQILRRTGNHTRQSSLKGKARVNNLRKAFTLADDYTERLQQNNVLGKVWVVDDILTTGATLRHACKIMKGSKQSVFAFSLARVIHD